LGAGLTFGLKGLTTLPMWLRGYSVTPGDLDTGSATLTYPLLTCGANTFTVSSNFILVSGLSFTGSKAGNVFSVTGTTPKIAYCRFAGTGASASTVAATGSGFWSHCSYTAASTVNAITTIAGFVYDSYFAGFGSGSTQVGMATTTGTVLDHCTFYQCGSHGVTFTSTGTFTCDFCTFYQCGGDSIRFNTSIPATGSSVTNSYFYQSGNSAGTFYDINYNIATVTGNVFLQRNVSNSPSGSSHLNGFGDWTENGALSESINPFVSSTDLHLISTSVGKSAALPQQWENQAAGITSSPDVGAWQTLSTVFL
jgi:hypothetical protein